MKSKQQLPTSTPQAKQHTQRTDTDHTQQTTTKARTRKLFRDPTPYATHADHTPLPQILNPYQTTGSTLHNHPTQQITTQIQNLPQSTQVHTEPDTLKRNAFTEHPTVKTSTANLTDIPNPDDPASILNPSSSTKHPKKRARWLSLAMIIVLLIALYLLWQPVVFPSGDTSATDITSTATVTYNTNNLNSSNSTHTTSNTATGAETSTSTSTNSDDSTKIQAYIVGAVYHPGIYSLAANARVYQLVQAAGGPLPDANMTVVNLAARLIDGQEVYVSHINETPPASIGGNSNSASNTTTASTTPANQGPKININTASSAELQQGLSISSKSAEKIITYRVQHGPYPSVDALAQAVSKSMYNKLKNKVSV
jgi:DNA uptake protein and related DNA-binding proteins